MRENDQIHDENERIRRLTELDKNLLRADGRPDFNRLIFASSPYLLQHADNPVDWYEWGDDAFARAREEDKPVFLSIGYATCHWCHVMAHESFADPKVAAVFNRHFIAIKVDREERPDIDEQYMTVAQMMTGSGGWPLNIFMTPDREPFLAMTYVHRTARMGMSGIVELLENVARLWADRRDLVESNCSAVLDSLRKMSEVSHGELPVKKVTDAALRQIASLHDRELGGFGQAPKFPMPIYLSYLLRCGRNNESVDAVGIAAKTLYAMRNGGIYDQLGFGFHRYSVDREWLVPHFEKMLYDQALIAIAGMEAFQVTGDRFFIGIAEEIFTYVLKEMTSPEGGFYSAQDADSEGEEGRFYLWTPAQVRDVLGEEDAGLFCRIFDVTEAGNFEGRNILHLPVSLEVAAERNGMEIRLLPDWLEQWRSRLYEARAKRIPPLRDEKILTAWNGLMIAALARGFAVTGDSRWRVAAERGVAFVLDRLVDPRGRLQRSYFQGRSTVPAFLEDYAFFVWGLIELYEATLAQEPLEEAVKISREMLRLFRDDSTGALQMVGNDAEELLVRQVNAYDGVIPSGISVAAMNLVKLGKITNDRELAAAGEAVVRAFSGKVEAQPAGYLHLLLAANFLHGPEIEITLTGNRDAPQMTEMLRVVGKRLIPGLVLKWSEKGERAGSASGVDRVVAHICAAGACRPPVAAAGELASLLDTLE